MWRDARRCRDPKTTITQTCKCLAPKASYTLCVSADVLFLRKREWKSLNSLVYRRAHSLMSIDRDELCVFWFSLAFLLLFSSSFCFNCNFSCHPLVATNRIPVSRSYETFSSLIIINHGSRDRRLIFAVASTTASVKVLSFPSPSTGSRRKNKRHKKRQSFEKRRKQKKEKENPIRDSPVHPFIHHLLLLLRISDKYRLDSCVNWTRKEWRSHVVCPTPLLPFLWMVHRCW